MTSQPPKHILMLPIHMWGRARPLAVLASRMVRMRPILITLCIADKLWDRTKAEIESDFTPEEGEYLSRIRLLRIEQGADWMDSAGIRDHFLKIWSSLCAGESVAYEAVDGSTGLINLLSEPLNAIVIDNLIVEVMEALHKHRLASPRSLSLRLYAWSPVSSDFMVAQGRTDPMPFVRALQEQQNISLADAAVAVFNTKHGRLIQSPCLPDMYDYEFSPQSYPFPKEIVARIFTKVVEAMDWMDGLLTFDALDYHPEASNAYKAHLAQRNQKAYYAGPLIPARHPAPPAGDARGAQESMQFLERQLEERGVRSVIYVSFGSQYWPQDPAKLAAALELLVEQKIPFIMSRPSAAAKLSDDLIQRLSGNPDIYLGNWLPQQAILDHPATGWCLTHGGHNTVLECIHFGIPMMIWPITADQPVNAVHLSYNAKMAYELIEVRNGVGAGVIHRTGKAPLGTIDAVRDELRSVLARAFGEDGAAKRQRVLRLREVLAGAWAENGVARREVGEFLDDVTTMPAA